MPDNERMARLRAAWALLDNATHDEKRELFSRLINALEHHKDKLEGDDSRFEPHSSQAFSAMSKIRIFCQRLTAYNIGWVPEYYAEHCSDQGGRPSKYNLDTRELDCFFITQMVFRGSSETQAMKLLMRLKGDGAMTQGHMRELQDTYREYKKLGRSSDYDKSIADNAHLVAEFLRFDVSNLEGPERASQKAVSALRSFCQELIDFMKASHELVASKDREYPDIFGPVIEWLELEYEDPLNYFFGAHIDPETNFHIHRRGLLEFLNMAFHYQEEYGDKSVEGSFFHSRKN